jgi:hypothetical protein
MKKTRQITAASFVFLYASRYVISTQISAYNLEKHLKRNPLLIPGKDSFFLIKLLFLLAEADTFDSISLAKPLGRREYPFQQSCLYPGQ